MASPPPPPPPPPPAQSAPQVWLQQQQQLLRQKGTDAPGSGAANSNHIQDSHAGLLGGAQPLLAGQDKQSQAHLGAAADDGLNDPTPQNNGKVQSSDINPEMDTTANHGEQTLSIEELDRMADEWEHAGKPKCPSCGASHPPPCDPNMVQFNKELKALKSQDKAAYKAKIAIVQDKRRADKEARRLRKLQSSGKAVDTDVAMSGTPSSARKPNSTSAPKGKKQSRAQYARKFKPSYCTSCQAYHEQGQHIRTKQEASELLTQQAYGQAPVPDTAPIKGAKAARLIVKTANMNTPKATPEEAKAKIAQQVADQKERTMAFIQQAPALLETLTPQHRVNFMAGLFHANMGPITALPSGPHMAPPPPPPPPPPQAAAYAAPAPTTFASTAHNVPQGMQYNIAPEARAPAPAPKRRAETNQPRRDNTRGKSSKQDQDANNKRPQGNKDGESSKKDVTANSANPKGSFKKGDKYSLISSAPVGRQLPGGEKLMPDPEPPSGKGKSTE